MTYSPGHASISVAISTVPYDASNVKNFGQIRIKNDEIKMRRVGLTNVEGRGKATHAMQSRIYGNNIDERFHIVLICIHVASSSMAEDNVNASVRIHVYVKRMWLFFPYGKSQFAQHVIIKRAQ